MLKFSSFLVLAFLSGSLCFSAPSRDSIQLGAGITNNVYYSFSGERTSVPASNWDIAFEIPGFSSAILSNTVKGVQVWNVPTSTGESFDMTIDTTAIFATPALQNSTTSWSAGAFNMGKDYNTGDFGWGQYNIATHTVSGSTVFVIKLANKEVKKFIVDALTTGVYSFRYANIDGTNLQTKTITKKDFPNKNFMYFSLESGTSIDREPAQWDLFFGKYTVFIPTAYNVTGVLTNRGAMTAVYKGGNPKGATSVGLMFEESMSTIGWDKWKTFTGSTYAISDSLAYFVQTTDGSIRRLIFTGFGGSATGAISFEFESIATSVSEENGAVISSVALYPNPSYGTATALFSTPNTGSEVELAIWDILGNKIQSVRITAESNLMQHQISGLSSGIYTVTATVNGHTSAQKLIVE